jgi:hypothetical protein
LANLRQWTPRRRGSTLHAMTDHLRSIAVKVEEPRPGVFHWVLIESTDDAAVFKPLSVSPDPYDNWLLALVAGVEALQRMTGDSSRGPRLPGEDENADPVG